MPLTDQAYFEGDFYPRCTATPTAEDIEAGTDQDMSQGTWECALPEPHPSFPNPAHHPHSWVDTSGK